MEIENYINIQQCTKLEQNIYQFFDSFESDINDYSAEMIAELCCCSTATLNRFFRKCGYSGYGDFKHNYIHLANANTYFHIHQSTNDVYQFSQKLINSRKIIIFGFGTSHIAAQYLYYKLIKLNFPIILIIDRYDLSRIEHDTAIIISNTGASRAIISIINSDYDCSKILSITKSNSPLAFNSAVALTHNTDMIIAHSQLHDEQIHLFHLIYEYEKGLRKIIADSPNHHH